MSIFVRARDGALYRDPCIVFQDGFIAFDELGAPELVLWLQEGLLAPRAYLTSLLGQDAFEAVGEPRDEWRAQPTGKQDEFIPARLARVWKFILVRRLPRPTLYAGVERYARGSRQEPVRIVVELPGHPFDAYEIEPSQSSRRR